MKIIFFGSDDFAAVHLQGLLSAGSQVLCCVTGPDLPQGRGMKITASPIKLLASIHQIPCLQPVTLKDKKIADTLRSYGADIFVVVSYGRLLTQEILDIPNKLCMNVHGSLLPKYRGAAPIQRAILNGDKETGVTIQKMALELDSGDIIAQQAMGIGEDENAGQLRSRMAQSGAKLLIEVLRKHPLGDFPLVPQDKTAISYAPKLTKEMGQIDWKKSAQSIVTQVRGLQPWPGAHTIYHGKKLKVTQAQVSTESASGLTPGQVISTDKKGFCVSCGTQVLLIKEVQPEAGKLMPAASFVAGYKIAPGIRLGE